MSEFLVLIGRILLIAVGMMAADFFLEDDKYKNILKILRIACALFCLILLIEFASEVVFESITTFINFSF